MSIAKQLRFS